MNGHEIIEKLFRWDFSFYCHCTNVKSLGDDASALNLKIEVEIQTIKVKSDQKMNERV